jgi:hypothetical protein
MQWWSWARALLPVATTLAANPALPAEACSSNTTVQPTHVIAPFALPYAAHIVVHMPTLLLSSRSRVSTIRQALADFAAIFLGFQAAGWAFRSGDHALAYALSLHWSLFLLSQPPHPGLIIGSHVHTAVHAAALAALVWGAWQLGPPLPIIELPGFPALPGASSHLMCLVGTELLGPLILHALTRVADSE